MSLAFQDLFGIPDALGRLPVLGGRTDAWILAQAAAHHGVALDASTVERFHEAYLAHLSVEIHRPGPRKGVMPGVPRLLGALEANGAAGLALLTGNLERGARIKLEYFDLWRYFRSGAFGDRTHDRNGLLPEAIARAEACGIAVSRASDIVIVGDTPLDVAVARAGGARAVAVATGDHSADELRASGADVVLEDLLDLDAALSALELV